MAAKSELLGLAFFVGLFLSNASAQQPQTFFVNRSDPTCGGQHPCYTTIQAAINTAGPRTSIKVQAGVYPEQLQIQKNDFSGAVEADRIVIETDPNDQPGAVVLTGAPGACTGNHAIRLQQSKFVTIRGLTITGTGGQAISLMGGNNGNVGIHIELNRIFGNGSGSCNGGITVARNNSGTIIANNLIYANGRNGIAFIDADGGPHYIMNNTIYANQWNGIDVARQHQVTIVNNVANANGTAAGTTGGRFGIQREGSSAPQPHGITLINNLVCGNTAGQINGPMLDATDSGNFTPLGTEGPGVSAKPGCDDPANLFVNRNGADGVPNTADDDFSLKANSLAIDVGIDPRTLGLDSVFDQIFTADFLQESVRPADGNADRIAVFDASAYEFPNALPIADAGADHSAVRGQLVILNGGASSDPEGASLTFQWTVLSQPAGSSIALASANTVNPSFTPLLLGEYVIQLVVNDGQHASQPDAVKVVVVNRAPAASAGGPYTGNVNVPIQFSGSGTDPDGDPVTLSWNFGDGGTATGATPSKSYTVGGTYPVTLTVTDNFGASAISSTGATIKAPLTLNPIGNKTVNLGETLMFTVTASNPGGGLVSLYVAPLPLPANASFNASTGVFTFRPSGTQVGTYQLTFSAVAGVNTLSETIMITVPHPPPGGPTAVRGRVVNLAQTPLANVRVTVRSSGQTSFSGADGFFTITGTPSGTQQLIVNGREANLGVYAIIAVAVELIDGVLTDLSSPISLPDVDVDAEVQVSPTFNTTVTNPSLPGVELEIIGGSATNPDGTLFAGKLSINPVPDYGRPESRPEELRPGMAVTIQPAGIRFNPPARITFPNADGMVPGNELNLWSLSPDTGKFNIVGKSAVSADGQSIVTVEGGVTASAWHFPLATATTSNPSQGSNFCGSCRTSVGSEANLEEGSLYITHFLPSYNALGQRRSLSLTYSSITSDPRPIINLDSTLSVRAGVPSTFSTRLKVGGVQQGGEIFTNSSALPEDADSTSRLSVQFDASNLATGRYPFEATVFSNYLNSSVGGISTGDVIVVNRSASAVGAGWAITDVQQLHLQTSGGALLTSGDGTALFFSGGPTSFSSPARDFSTLVKNPDGSYTRTLKNGTKINFSAQGLQTSIVDRNANTTNFVYDGSGRLTTVTDPVGLITSLTYSGARLQSITDPAGRKTLFQHDGAGNLTRIINPDSSFMTYAYDGKGHITQATDERGLNTNYAYDFAGRFALSTRPGGETRALVSSKLRGLVDSAAGQGTPTNPAPVVTGANATASLSDGRGNQSKFALDALGQVTSQIDALNQTTTTVRDANGLPTRISRPNGAVTTMTYDAKGNLLTTTDPVGATTIFTYDPIFNQVKTIRDPKGNLTTINYDANGNPIEIIDALNNRTQMTYDSRGLLTSVTSAVGTPVQSTTSFTYDTRGNLLTTTNPKGDVTTLAYDGAGNVSNTTDAERRVTQFTYDARNRLVTVLDADLKTTQYGYDPKGNLTQVRDAKNQVTTFAYDNLDRLLSATNPLGLTERFTYDGNGNLTSSTNRNGQTITFNYDALNRLTGKTRPPTSNEVGNQTTTYSYDSVGNLLSVVNPMIGVFNQYDAANRLVSSISSAETTVADTVIPINVDTTINANNLQFEGKTLQVNGRILTVNGSHTFANLVLVNGSVLTHSPTTASTTAKLDITVTGSLQVDATSRIDVSGRGFLGHFQPGNNFSERGMTIGFQPGSLCASGGGYGGLGGTNGCSAAVSNPMYGDFRNPNEGGSGGGGVLGGLAGNGGGSIRIVAQSLQLNGSIVANGQNAPGQRAAGGSGGGIRIDVGTLQGTGSITARGGNGGQTGTQPAVGTSGGGGGRIAIYYQNASGFNFANVFSNGGTGVSGPNGGAGTFYLQGPSRENGELVVDNNNLGVDSLSTPIPNPTSGNIALTNFRVRRAARVRIDSILNISNALEVNSNAEIVASSTINATTIDLTDNSVISHIPASSATTFKVDIAANSFAIDATSRIDVSGRGFLGHNQPGNTFIERGMTVGFQPGSLCASGGGYGGLGGTNGCSAAASNPVYGDFRNPSEVGSGGGGVLGGGAGNGGGLIRIVAQNFQLNGSILANGQSATGQRAAGGSGGGIQIDVGILQGTGSVSARGGNGGPTGTQPSVGTSGGGGGRVAIYYQSAAGFDFANVFAHGGTGVSGPNGGGGTVYLQGTSRENGELIVDNNNIIAPSLSTPIPSAPSSGTLVLTHLRVRRAARGMLNSPLNLTGTLEVVTSGEFLVNDRIVADSITLTSHAVLSHPATTGTSTFKVDVGTQTFAIDATSRIDVNGRGYLGGRRPGNPFANAGMTAGFVQGSTTRTGGSYGGLGGIGFNGVAGNGVPNPVYGDFRNPNDAGSGGGNDSFNAGQGGNGGGLIRIIAQTLQLDGAIRANGANATGDNGGGGSGGGIRIDVGTLQGIGQISASGGEGSPKNQSGVGDQTGGGGGGRVAIYYQNATGFDLANVTATGGVGHAAPNGQNGTVHAEQQIAMLAPTIGELPVMLSLSPVEDKADAEIESKVGNPVRVAFADVPQRRVFDPSIFNPRSSIVETPGNRYLTMVAEETLKPFATTAMLSQGKAGPEINAIGSDNPKWGIQNPKLDILPDACCSLPGTELAPQASRLTPSEGVAPEDFDPIYTYDLNGNRISMIDPTGLTTYTYDALNRLTSITNNQGQLTSFAYDALGRRTSLTHANGIVTSYQYDSVSQLLNLAHQLGATTINSFTYAYDKVGNRKSKAESSGTANYTYDVLNRLTQAANPLPTNPLETYNYDPVGNRINSNQNGASIFNQANQLVEDANFTNQYDNNGNLTLKTPKTPGPFTSYEYDAENKLVRAVTNGTTANYKYDGLGRRVEKEVINVGTTVTRYVYDNEDILLELNGSNQIVARYTHGPGIDEPLIMERTGQLFYYHADALGSITELTNHSGTITQRYTYSSFGKIESQIDLNFVQPYTYTSREFDAETGLYHYRARYYESATGRFITEDPIGFVAGPNFYSYVTNNPINWSDPFGLFITPDTILDLGSILYDIYKLIAEHECNLDENLSALGLDIIGAIVPGATGLGAASRVSRAANRGDLVIGRGSDLAKTGALKVGEYKLSWESKFPDYRAEWKENAGRLREVMNQGLAIRDASPGDTGGIFLEAERRLLRDRGWTFDPATNYWRPPKR